MTKARKTPAPAGFFAQPRPSTAGSFKRPQDAKSATRQPVTLDPVTQSAMRARLGVRQIIDRSVKVAETLNAERLARTGVTEPGFSDRIAFARALGKRAEQYAEDTITASGGPSADWKAGNRALAAAVSTLVPTSVKAGSPGDMSGIADIVERDASLPPNAVRLLRHWGF